MWSAFLFTGKEGSPLQCYPLYSVIKALGNPKLVHFILCTYTVQTTEAVSVSTVYSMAQML